MDLAGGGALPANRRLFCLLIALLLSSFLTPILRAALAKSDATPDGSSLAGQLLIASPDMGDPRFAHSVVLIVQHDREGAFGIVINHLIEKRPLADLLAATGEPDAGVEGSVSIFLGGPVQPAIGFIVHSADYHRAETVDIDGRVAMTPSRKVLSDIGHHQGPAKFLIAFGYAGWGPGQLEDELARHGWFTAPEDPQLVFDDNRTRVWEDAMARRTRDL
jgi:putative transcriptional regulator